MAAATGGTMTLDIDTFSNVSGGFSFFKALGHPVAAPRIRALLDRLAAAGPVAIYDPLGHAAAFAALYDIDDLDCAGIYVQDLEAIEGYVKQGKRKLTEDDFVEIITKTHKPSQN